MSKHKKTLDKLCATPAPSDFTWNELKNVLEHFGFEMTKASGSARRFRHTEKNVNLFFHEPHPKKTILVCYIKEAIQSLKEHGFIK